MKLICKSDGFLQTGQSLFGAEIHQRQSLQLVYQILEARKKIKSGARSVRSTRLQLLDMQPLGFLSQSNVCYWIGLFFAPGFLLMFYFVMNILEAKGWRDFESKMRGSYWTALKMNWKVWTPFQFVNIHFVPVEFRVLFANMVALFWYAYLASVRK
ncbi:hypothetical protein KUCAC02_028459 [Chaenocephalus aceratus]|uniref:Uncharacterized protein n=1 Tax=Chaenocephalus aceratus TaxID=36190 RepID=A0ACB9X243_CHAAC|nr:hypothetical protein KUCAC02_028459 [Chaenocephalus aceratus]